MVTTSGPTQLSPWSEADTIPELFCSGPQQSLAIHQGSLGRQSRHSPWWFGMSRVDHSLGSPGHSGSAAGLCYQWVSFPEIESTRKEQNEFQSFLLHLSGSPHLGWVLSTLAALRPCLDFELSFIHSVSLWISCWLRQSRPGASWGQC